MMIEALCNVSGHLDMLNLVTPHRDPMRIKNQDIRGHEDGIRK